MDMFELKEPKNIDTWLMCTALESDVQYWEEATYVSQCYLSL